MNSLKTKIKIKTKKGFTLFEVIVSTGILAIIATLCLTLMTTSANIYKKSSADTRLNTLSGRVSAQLNDYAIEAVKVTGAGINFLSLEMGDGSLAEFKLSDEKLFLGEYLLAENIVIFNAFYDEDLKALTVQFEFSVSGRKKEITKNILLRNISKD